MLPTPTEPSVRPSIHMLFDRSPSRHRPSRVRASSSLRFLATARIKVMIPDTPPRQTSSSETRCREAVTKDNDGDGPAHPQRRQGDQNVSCGACLGVDLVVADTPPRQTCQSLQSSETRCREAVTKDNDGVILVDYFRDADLLRMDRQELMLDVGMGTENLLERRTDHLIGARTPFGSDGDTKLSIRRHRFGVRQITAMASKAASGGPSLYRPARGTCSGVRQQAPE